MAGRVKRAARAEPVEQRGPEVELIWPGKSRADAACAMEPVPSPHVVERNRARDASARWRNRLLHGDNLAAMRGLLAELEGQIDLIYLDPPFATGNAFEFRGDVGEVRERPNAIAARAYDDRWGRGRARWFDMLHERLQLVHRLLSDRGTFYLHLDWWAGHHARVLLDEIFGADNSLGEIVWSYGSPSGGRAAGQKLIKAHDILYVFAKRYGQHRFKTVYLPYSEKYLRDWFKYEEPDGRRFRKRWRRDAEGRSYVEKQYLDESRGVPASTVWSDIQQVYADPRAYKNNMTSEVTGYPTQKPLRLLERILEISTEPGDLVADFFCGSGTTLVAAEKMGRRWIGCDEGALAVHTTRKRLLELDACEPYEIARLLPKDGGAPRPLAEARLRVEATLAGRRVALRLDGVDALPASLPEGLRETVREPLDLIDAWAVDWAYDGAVFEPSWTACRTRRDRALQQDASHEFSRPGVHRVAVVATDVFGHPLRWEQAFEVAPD